MYKQLYKKIKKNK